MYREHFVDLCRAARRYLDTEHAAEEAVQESFCRFAALTQCPREGAEISYLRSIVLNEARSTLRRRLMVERAGHRLAAPDPVDTTVELAIELDRSRYVDEQLGRLPARQRQVVALRHLVGFSEEETAAALAISAGSVKTHSSRGLSSIRNRIGHVA
jgi:RNA polymerase sigma factor (sigma-70 family)